jgi:hypothetical protein
VPRGTFLYKFKGISPKECLTALESILKMEEEPLVQWIFTVGKAGFPMAEVELLDSIQLLVTEKGKIFQFHVLMVLLV